jgi:hypothetical protein
MKVYVQTVIYSLGTQIFLLMNVDVILKKFLTNKTPRDILSLSLRNTYISPANFKRLDLEYEHMKKQLGITLLIVALLTMGTATATIIQISNVNFTTSTWTKGTLGGGCGGGCGGHGGGGGCHNNSTMVEMTGVLAYDQEQFTMDTTILCFGCYNYLNSTIAPADIDGDGVTETLWNEILGCVGTTITVEGYLRCQNTHFIVYFLNGYEIRDCPNQCPGLNNMG